MVKRKIIEINEDKCNGCGNCVPNCQEGALQIIDGKARLISDLFCDGLGACIGHCPQGAINIVKREAEPYDEKEVMKKNVVPKGINTIKAHLNHLKDHNAIEYFNEARDYLNNHKIKIDLDAKEPPKMKCGCPGTMARDFTNEDIKGDEEGARPSQLKQWPIQMHLINPNAPYFIGKDVLLAADCTAYSAGDFHKDFLKGKSLIIACPKLDSDKEEYIKKLSSMFDDANIKTLTVLIMEVPCCGGLLEIAKQAREKAKRKISINSIVVGIKGNIIRKEEI